MKPKGVVGASGPKWIPVTERLPETREIVMVYLSDGDMGMVSWDKNNKWFWEENPVTHWMPLPEPPEVTT